MLKKTPTLFLKLTSVLATVFLGCFIVITPVIAQSENSNNEKAKSIYESGHLYIAVDDQMAAIDSTLARAKGKNKLALIIMGANWCHDSRSMASNLYLPEVKKSIDTHYELLFVDVGYYTKIETVINRFGMPIIYSTPTVLIIDPKSENVINKHNMLLMRDAASVSVKDTIAYFSDIASKRKQLTKTTLLKEINPRLISYNQSIDQFEQFQAKRIYRAFSIIGPLIKKKKEGEEVEDFGKTWKVISKLRYVITNDLENLREKAKQLANKGDVSEERENLEFPKYPAFDWETRNAK